MKRIVGLKNKGGSGNSAPPPNFDEVATTAESKADSVAAKIEKLDTELRRYKDQLGKMREGPAKRSVKQKAMRVLQQKKVYEKQMDNLRQHAFNMEQVTFATQTMKDAQTTIGVMKAGVKSMKKELKKLNIEDIDDLQDDMAEMKEFADEIQEVLGRSYDMPLVDDDDLESELEALGEEMAQDDDTSYLDEALSNPPSSPEPQKPHSQKKADALALDEYGLPQIPNDTLKY